MRTLPKRNFQKEVDAQNVVEQQSEALDILRTLRDHSTVRSNTKLRTMVEGIWTAVMTANAFACVVWFATDTHADVEELLPPPAA